MASSMTSPGMESAARAAVGLVLMALIIGLTVPGSTVLAQERGEFKPGESSADIPEDVETAQLGIVFEEIARATNQGLTNLIPVLNTLLALLLIISLILTFIFGAFQEDFSPFVMLLKKAILVGFLLYFISEWDVLRASLIDGAAQIGLIAGNSDLASGSVLNPANVAGRGFALALAVLRRVIDLTGPVAFFTNFAAILIYIVAALIILAAFLILAIVVFVALVEFYIGTTVAVILFPLGVLRATSFAAQTAFGYVIASAVKIAVLALIIGLSTSIFIDPLLDREPDPLQGEALGIAFISLALAVTAWSASSLAAGLVSGGPSLGAGAAVGPAVTAAAGGALALGGAGAAARALGGVAGRAGGGAVAGGSGGGGAAALLGRSSPPSLGGPGGAPALSGPKIAGLLPAPGGGGGGSSSSGGGSSGGGGGGGSGAGAANLPAVAGQSPPAVAGQSPPAIAGISPVARRGGSSAGSAGGSGPDAGGSGVGGGSNPRPYMTRPAAPPAGEGNGGRGARWAGRAAAYAAQQAVMADRGGGGYQGPNLDRD